MSTNGTPSTPAVAELVARARQGELLAWHALFHSFRNELARECVGRIPRDLRSRFDPEDVIQAAFLSAFEHIREFEYRGEGSFRAWLRRILDNALRDGIKHHCRTKRSPSLEKSGDQEGADPLANRRCDRPEEVAGEEEDRRRLRRAVMNLPCELRLIVELRVDQGRTFNEIADELELSPTTVRRRVHAALERIQHELHPAAAG
jgi:RNA polymerase sigma-70 factor, ECF subfamily